ncbi:hypothetical protein [Pontitalea aquivivens]
MDAALDGVAKVLTADDAAYAHGLAEPLADLPPRRPTGCPPNGCA